MLLAAGTTIAWWAGADIGPLLATPEIRRGEWWRLVTDIFPHHDPMHLLFDLYWLWVFGALVEQIFGHVKTAALLLLFAVGSSALEFAFLDGGVGLSGVGYGFFGLLWILSRHDSRFQDAIDDRTIKIFLIWFVFCIFTTIAKILPVANLAHGGGLLLGVLTGAAISMRKERVPAVAGAAAVLLFSLWAATLGRPRINLSSRGGAAEGHWGFEALTQNRNAEAVRWLRDAATYQPAEAPYWFDLGIAYWRAGDRKSATVAFERAQRLEPQNQKYSAAAADSKESSNP